MQGATEEGRGVPQHDKRATASTAITAYRDSLVADTAAEATVCMLLMLETHQCVINSVEVRLTVSSETNLLRLRDATTQFATAS